MDGSDVARLKAEVEGLAEFVAWFGYWPTFHDAEVTRVELRRSEPSCIDVLAFETGDSVDSDGYHVRTKAAIVSFWFEQIQHFELRDFNQQNVLAGLAVAKVSARYSLKLEPCFGLSGVVVAESLRITFMPVAQG